MQSRYEKCYCFSFSLKLWLSQGVASVKGMHIESKNYIIVSDQWREGYFISTQAFHIQCQFNILWNP